MFPILLAGLLAGSQHVVTGADHMAAVGPLAVDAPRRAWATGLHWGLGHAAGITLLGGLFLALRELVPVDAISAWSETLIGLVLLIIGGRGLWLARARAVAGHVHGDGTTHGATALGTGTIHGFAGTSHLVGVVAALALPTRAEACGYLVGFAAGNVLMMVGFTALLGLLAARLGRREPHLRRRLLVALSVVTIAVGVFWLAPSVA